MPASARARSRSLPAGPTKGWPVRSSSLPGCSPTNMSFALLEPSPKTVCVPRFHKSHARQFLAASRTFARVGRSGIRSAAPVGFGRFDILERERDVASQALYLGPLHRTPAERPCQLIVATLGQRQEIDAVPRLARLPGGVVRSRRDGGPRAD